MDKTTLLTLFTEARRRAEAGDLDIMAQYEIIRELEKQGLPSEKARAILARLIEAQDIDLAEMERLLDVMDQG
ncbi:hypothetical protein G5V57_24230 [Nordella sp. HKS 07]|uniref:hypothetical protein n=1 Tax=Nordella sp. HKS 07 TaxID=2712222 RepID=UPI0013E1569E|nr:hypothetical protein [Nordella sp. HKS 07]QIG50562.1 hypothetical protein G5V57_24230 [Nordella sp. HKS 07]